MGRAFLEVMVLLAPQCVDDWTSSPPGDIFAFEDSLETARCKIETMFLSAGEVLSEAVDGIAALINALDDITSALDPAAIEATVSDLHNASGTLTALPSHHHARWAVVSDLDRHRLELGRTLLDMHRSLAYMRAFTINMKITAGGIVSTDAEFTLFAQEISDRIEAGRSELDSLQHELDALQEPISAVFGHGATMAERCGELIPLVPDELNASAGLIGDHHRTIATAAASSAGLARDVRSKVGRILAALQIGDITRQRIEHVQSGLVLLRGLRRDLTTEQYDRAATLFQVLLTAQLGETVRGFEREVEQIGGSLAGLAADAAALLELRDLAHRRDRSEKAGVLQALEGRLNEALALVEEIETAEREVLATAQTTAAAAQVVAGRLAAVQMVKTDVQFMAINATLKSCRIGDAGRPLATIAVELRTHAAYLEQAANRSLTVLNALLVAAGGLTDEKDDPDADVALGRSGAKAAKHALGAAAERISQAKVRTESDLMRLAERGEAVLALLDRSSGRLDFREQIGQAMGDVAGELTSLAQNAQPCDPDIQEPLAASLTSLYATYTMDQERSVHAAFAEAWRVGAACPAPTVATAPSDDLEDVLF